MRTILISICVCLSIAGKTQSTKTYNDTGLSKYTRQDYRGAIVDFTKAIEVKPDDEYSYFYRGSSKYSLQDYRGAVADYSKAIEIKADDIEAYLERGRSKFNLQDYRGAIVDFTKVIEIKDQNEKYNFAIPYTSWGHDLKLIRREAYDNRGLSKLNLQDYEGAITDFTTAIEIDPKVSSCYLRRGVAKIQLGQKDSGCLDLSKAGELGNEKAYEIIRTNCN